ncbi:MAG: hypothetical protein ACREFU_03880 [Acetobacteraceae bacterium]
MAQMVPNVGVDVSKDRLEVGLCPGEERFSVGNDAVGWHELTRRLRPLGVRAVGPAPPGLRHGRITAPSPGGRNCGGATM